MRFGKLNPLGKINFPGFQKILDFTATGSESSVSVTVDGDTDKEYRIILRTLASLPANPIIRLNSDAGNNYGEQFIQNNAGSLSATRQTLNCFYFGVDSSGGSTNIGTLLTPAGLIKTLNCFNARYSSGTTISLTRETVASWNNTANVTSITLLLDGAGNYTAGSNLTIYARRTK